MNRTYQVFPISDFFGIKLKMLNWGNQFNICSFLDNHQYQLKGNRHECLGAFGSHKIVRANSVTALTQLQFFLTEAHDWCFGHLSYELKNQLEFISPRYQEVIGFPDFLFFIPEYVIELKEGEMRIGSLSNDHHKVFDEILSVSIDAGQHQTLVHIKERINRAEYINTIKKIQQHILHGDCYELNYCMEFFAMDAVINPLQTYQALARLSPNPFAAYYKVENSYLLCASPERFLQKQGRQIITQPIKGTLKRNVNNLMEDALHKQKLFNSAKDRSENVMVVDLMRNDLSRVCKEGTVHVEELFGIYSFPQVHQMISTVRGELRDEVNFTDIIKATFPMGSMTGAPKQKVMELIDEYEPTARGVFSGAVGYISPEGDFDFNVVIRSILYNQCEKYLSYFAGSGITFYSDAQREYDECLLKAEAIRKVLEIN